MSATKPLFIDEDADYGSGDDNDDAPMLAGTPHSKPISSLTGDFQMPPAPEADPTTTDDEAVDETEEDDRSEGAKKGPVAAETPAKMQEPKM